MVIGEWASFKRVAIMPAMAHIYIRMCVGRLGICVVWGIIRAIINEDSKSKVMDSGDRLKSDQWNRS